MDAAGIAPREPRVARPTPSSSARDLIFDPENFRRFASLAEAFYFHVHANPLAVAYDQAQIVPGEEDRPRPYLVSLNCERRDRVLKIAACLDSLGVGREDAVAILSFERPEWVEAELAIHTVGAVVIPAYVRDGDERLRFILRDGNATYAFAENQEQVDKLIRLTQAAEQPIQLHKIISFEDAASDQRDDEGRPLVVTLADILATSQVSSEESFAWLATHRDDLAEICYTSGSSGLPKGVPISHGQILANLFQMSVVGLVDYEQFMRPDRKLAQPFVTMLLPERAHAYPGRVGELVATTPVRGRYPAIVDRRSCRIDQAFRESIRRDLQEGAAGLVPIVPKVLIAIQQRVRERLATGGLAGWLIGRVIASAARKHLLDAKGTPSAITNFLYRLLTPLRRPIVRRIRRKIVSPEFEFFIAGGAKLPLDTGAFLWALDIPVYEGYGSTETNCPIATNVPGCWRLGSVGKLFAGVDARRHDTGELLVRGPNIALKYWNQDEETRRSWTDDWYHTRDLGEIDGDGFVYVFDRVDNILVLLNGENVSATEIEGRFAEIPLVETTVVVGHQREGLVALVALNEEAVRRRAERAGHTLAQDMRNDPAVMLWLRQEVEEKVNAPAQRCFDRVRQIAIIDSPKTEEQTLTATEKTNRSALLKRHAALVESLYAQSHEWLPENGRPAVTSLAANA